MKSLGSAAATVLEEGEHVPGPQGIPPPDAGLWSESDPAWLQAARPGERC